MDYLTTGWCQPARLGIVRLRQLHTSRTLSSSLQNAMACIKLQRGAGGIVYVPSRVILYFLTGYEFSKRVFTVFKSTCKRTKNCIVHEL